MIKRIAFISEHASPLAALGGADAGGQNVYVGELAKQMAAAGYAVDLFTRREDTDLQRCIEWAEGIRIVHIDAGPPKVIAKETLLQYMPAFRDDMLAFMNEQRISYDLIHANFFMSALVAMELKAILQIPFVVTFHALGHIRRLHQGNNDRFPPERIAIEEAVCRKADNIIAECPQDREDLIHYYNAPEEKITVIPCGVNTEEFYPVNKRTAREMLGLPEDEILLLQLGRMVPRKGVDNVIEAFARLNHKAAKMRLLIVGGDTDTVKELERLKELAAKLKVEDRIVFTGQKSRAELKFYYAAADLFITTPWYEPFGITPLEAMACGTPVIGSMVGGIKYSVADGQTGVLVSPKNPNTLANTIRSLLRSPGQLKEMGVNAVRRVNRMFTWELVASQMLAVYESVCGRQNVLPYEKSNLY